MMGPGRPPFGGPPVPMATATTTITGGPPPVAGPGPVPLPPFPRPPGGPVATTTIITQQGPPPPPPPQPVMPQPVPMATATASFQTGAPRVPIATATAVVNVPEVQPSPLGSRPVQVERVVEKAPAVKYVEKVVEVPVPVPVQVESRRPATLDVVEARRAPEPQRVVSVGTTRIGASAAPPPAPLQQTVERTVQVPRAAHSSNTYAAAIPASASGIPTTKLSAPTPTQDVGEAFMSQGSTFLHFRTDLATVTELRRTPTMSSEPDAFIQGRVSENELVQLLEVQTLSGVGFGKVRTKAGYEGWLQLKHLRAVPRSSLAWHQRTVDTCDATILKQAPGQPTPANAQVTAQSSLKNGDIVEIAKFTEAGDFAEVSKLNAPECRGWIQTVHLQWPGAGPVQAVAAGTFKTMPRPPATHTHTSTRF